jgi:hypothetical protein
VATRTVTYWHLWSLALCNCVSHTSESSMPSLARDLFPMATRTFSTQLHIHPDISHNKQRFWYFFIMPRYLNFRNFFESKNASSADSNIWVTADYVVGSLSNNIVWNLSHHAILVTLAVIATTMTIYDSPDSRRAESKMSKGKTFRIDRNVYLG